MLYVQVFQTYLDSSEYPGFNPETHAGHWRQLTLRSSRQHNLMALIDFNPQQLSQVTHVLSPPIQSFLCISFKIR